MSTLTRASTSSEYTGSLAAALGALLLPGDVVTLEGELGAGKTTFARSLATSLGVPPGLISSPTYVFVNIYPTGNTSHKGSAAGIRRVIHADCYRLTGTDDLDPLGWDQLFDPHTRAAAADAVAVVEWPSRIPDAAMLPSPEATARVTIEATGRDHRRVTFQLPGSWSSRADLRPFIEREPVRCPVTAAWVSPLSPTYPFADQRARDADLYKWFSGQYTASRAVRPEDTDDEV